MIARELFERKNQNKTEIIPFSINGRASKNRKLRLDGIRGVREAGALPILNLSMSFILMLLETNFEM